MERGKESFHSRFLKSDKNDQEDVSVIGVLLFYSVKTVTILTTQKYHSHLKTDHFQ